MSFIRDPRTADDVDTHGVGPILNNTRLDPEQKHDAHRYLERHDALDLADMLGVTR